MRNQPIIVIFGVGIMTIYVCTLRPSEWWRSWFMIGTHSYGWHTAMECDCGLHKHTRKPETKIKLGVSFGMTSRYMCSGAIIVECVVLNYEYISIIYDNNTFRKICIYWMCCDLSHSIKLPKIRILYFDNVISFNCYYSQRQYVIGLTVTLVSIKLTGTTDQCGKLTI